VDMASRIHSVMFRVERLYDEDQWA
jgi:hypothetical protein